MKKYTIEDFKEKYDKAVVEVLQNPAGDQNKKKIDIQVEMSLMLSGILLFGMLKKKLFEEE